MKSVFITGTDTGVGKTRVTCALMRQLIAQGLRVVGMKPVASGGELHDGTLRNDDAVQLMATANIDVPYAWVNPYCFAPAIAPHIAAQQAATPILPEVILRAYQQLSAAADVVVVEGVGGWAVPINATKTMADIASMLNLPVMMVVGMRLGCLNHALLTAHGIQTSPLTLTAWIANTLEPAMPVLQENIDALKTFIAAPLVAVLPYLPVPTQANNVHFDLTVL
jgi:dethiobiotin synthetase